MKIKTSELIGRPLDWAVLFAQCNKANGGRVIQARDLMDAAVRNGMASPSTDWSQGGPIIEREKMWLMFEDKQWRAASGGQSDNYMTRSGPTPLIAAMRCFVASKLGDEVDVSESMLKE